MTDISVQDLQHLLTYFSKNTYKTNDADITSQSIMQRCVLLTNLDYTHSVIENNAGELCAHYPNQLIILQNERSRHANGGVSNDTPPPPLPCTTETIYESMYDPNKIKELIKNARFARCRSRFPLPVILYKGRHVCRSATLSSGPEIYGRSGIDYLFSGNDASGTVQQEEDESPNESVLSDWQLFDKVRYQDIKLLKTLNVGIIIDFMVEKKKVKFGMNVTSSEKVDKEKRYSDFTIVSLPYPGCEFFKEFRENDYIADGLVFDWSQAYIDAQIGVPEDSISTQLQINWQQYQLWDLVQLTQNYLILILRYLSDSNNGILIHCISGWDRTPLFISLLRISLWADGAVHTSLNPHQVLYYTIAYDWMLFGHDLADRLSKGEEIFLFCFYFLKYICDDKFSVHIYDDKFSIQRHNRSRHSILRNDNDVQFDVMFDNESIPTLSSISSNISLNSSSSSTSQSSRDSQDNPPSMFYSFADEDYLSGNVSRSPYPSINKESATRSPLPTNHTSPVSVPIPCRMRQRNESSSSSGSWQMISGTGSLRGSTSINSSIDSPLYGESTSKLHSTHTLQESGTIVEDDTLYMLSRKEKLESVRNIFYNIYSQHVGFRLKDNSESSAFGQIIGNIAEKVGIVSIQRTSL